MRCACFCIRNSQRPSGERLKSEGYRPSPVETPERISISGWGDATGDLAAVMSDAERHEVRAGLAAVQA
jgi:hypothetical protein